VAGKPGEGPLEKGDGGGLALVGQDLGIGQARSVVDRDMEVFPADAAGPVSAAVAGDAVADAGDLAELLGVEVDQLARPRALIAYDRWPRLERGQPAEPAPAQDAADGRERQAEAAGDLRPAQALPAQALDLVISRGSRRWRAGAELRSLRAGSPPARHRASHCARWAR
jgi:hypothetical protein